MTLPLENVAWIHGSTVCANSHDPLIQVQGFDDDTFVLRVSKCFSFEGNFIYLLFGAQRAVMFDTGGRASPDNAFNHGKTLPVRATVDRIVDEWLKKRGLAAVELVVAHTHGHGDHAAWDNQFVGRPHTTIVQPILADVKTFFRLPNWPNGQATIELGNRKLIVLPIPGHEAAHIATYDSRNKWLLTGDTLYAGLLTIADWDAYLASAARLARFALAHEIVAVMGNHIEMKRQPGELYTIGTTFQPDERPLPLSVDHLHEWNAACQAMANNPHEDAHDDFIIGSPS